MPSWDPQQYLKFSDQRTRPARELAAAVRLHSPVSALDVGCGPANSTAVIAGRWPDIRLTGLDSSADMLAAARKRLPNAAFVQRDIQDDLSGLGTFDLVFSNSALQWLPDMESAVLHLLDSVKAGGALAVQVPACKPVKTGSGRLETGDAHRLIYETSEEKEYSPYTKGITRFSEINANKLYDRLHPADNKIDIWETYYCHILDGYQGLVEWYRGTGLRPYLEALPDGATRERFETRFKEKTAAEFPLSKDGRLLFWFRRLFLIIYQ